MSVEPVWAPDAEPLDRVLKLRVSRRQLQVLDLAVKESVCRVRGCCARPSRVVFRRW